MRGFFKTATSWSSPYICICQKTFFKYHMFKGSYRYLGDFLFWQIIFPITKSNLSYIRIQLCCNIVYFMKRENTKTTLGIIQLLRHQRRWWMGWPNDDVWWQDGWVGVAKSWREQKICKEKTLFACAEKKGWNFL